MGGTGGRRSGYRQKHRFKQLLAGSDGILLTKKMASKVEEGTVHNLQ